MDPSYEIFGSGVAATIVANVMSVVADNIGAIVAVLGFFLGIALVLRLFRKASHGRV